MADRQTRPQIAFRTVRGHRVIWRDQHGVTHTCEGTAIASDAPGAVLIWTICGHADVPTRRVQFVADYADVDCPECLQQLEREEHLQGPAPAYEGARV